MSCRRRYTDPRHSGFSRLRGERVGKCHVDDAILTHVTLGLAG